MILVLCGRSASGKDATEKYLMKQGFERLISSTTRPMRPGEVDGVAYNFRTKEEFEHLIETDGLFEHRSYDTLVDGKPDTWYYGLEKRELNPKKNYIAVLTIDGIEAVYDYYKNTDTSVCAVYLDAPEELRRRRCERRGDFNKTEWNRRIKADRLDFSAATMKGLVSEGVLSTVKVDETQTISQIADEVLSRISTMQESKDVPELGDIELAI